MMARPVPAICTEFLERMQDDFFHINAKYPKLRVADDALRRVGNRSVTVTHRLAKDLRWTFRYTDDRNEHLEFNVECVPKRSLGIDEAMLAEVGDDANPLGRGRIDGDRLIYSVAIGHESKAHELDEHSIVGGNIKDFAVEAMMTMLRLLDRYGEKPAVIRKKTPSKSSDAIDDTTVGDQLRLSLETYLEDLIIEQWSQIDFGADLSFVERQTKCGDIGYLDILARDKATDGFVVIELKRHEGDDEVFGQVCRYMGWVGENLIQMDGVPVCGIIIASEASPKLTAAVSTNPYVRVLCYRVRIALDTPNCADAQRQSAPEEVTD